MFRPHSFLKISYKKFFFHFNDKRCIYNFTKKKKIKNNVLKRKDRIKKEKNIKLKEKLKIIFFSSIYFFSVDFIYHVYILKDKNESNSVNEEKKNINEKKEVLASYLNKVNILNKGCNTKSEPIQNEKIRNNEKKEIKIIQSNEDPYEIKINRIKRKDGDENYIEKELINKKNQIFGYNENNKMKNQENNIKDTIVNNCYRQPFLNGCNLFLLVNGVVFLSWRLSELIKNKKLYHFMNRHFICSYDNIKKKYYHTILTASISHITFPHFLFNMWAFHTITNALLSPEIKENKKSYLFFNYKSNILEKKINDKDIINICVLSSLLSTIPYIFLNKKNKILGASGAIMGLIYILSTVKPNEVFISIFPFPYLKLSSLQLCHLTIFTNFLFLFFKRNFFSVAWSAHLFGLLGGVFYNIYQRKNKNFNYYPFIELSLKNGYIDYLNSYLDFIDMMKCLQLRTKLFFSLDQNSIKILNKKIHTIKMLQSQRRLKFNIQKMKNLENMSK
ncbi:rhomboid protease ROM6, putative [Plasmodium gallinaceum]|uniref:Rhomboid protease ROM6, putative n=1 Tax=Plasmodium gallinaceum TaxID=5849 RepID=A0A1J1GSA1_PLAGA|nr:rhomboid protease ROM6, putative [Plasmodium gallinaceum]CRG95158.1 rhomboid protease ROM6, putative [Plasmodium gallinaceum]